MKIKTFILTLGFILISLFAFCVRATEEVKKNIEQSFKVSAPTTLNVSNQFGNIIVVEWGKKEVQLMIDIVGKGNDKETAQQLADRVTVEMKQNANTITARTVFKENNTNCNNCGTSVNYTIHVPHDIILELTNKFGNIALDNANQDFQADVQYGEIKINELKSNHNNLKIKFGKLELEKASVLNLVLTYSKASVNSVKELNMNSSYSSLKSEAIEKFQLTSKYDKFDLGQIGEMHMTSGYSDFRITDLHHNLEVINLKYSKIKIDNVDPAFKEITINAAYSPVKIGVGSQNNFKAKLTTEYGEINISKNIHSVVKQEKKESRLHYLNLVGGTKTDPIATITINNRYSNIILGK